MNLDPYGQYPNSQNEQDKNLVNQNENLRDIFSNTLPTNNQNLGFLPVIKTCIFCDRIHYATSSNTTPF
jgi:hypothetical protein